MSDCTRCRRRLDIDWARLYDKCEYCEASTLRDAVKKMSDERVDLAFMLWQFAIDARDESAYTGGNEGQRALGKHTAFSVAYGQAVNRLAPEEIAEVERRIRVAVKKGDDDV